MLSTNLGRASVIEGFAEPYQEIDVSAVADPAIITEIHVREGDAVQKGQVIANLDTRVLEASRQIARKRASMVGRIMAAQADLRMRTRQVEKLRMLRTKGHATQAELDRSEVDLAVAEAALMRAEEEQALAELEVKRIEAEIERRFLRSPIDGVVTLVHHEVGEATLISDPRVITLVQLSTLRVNFSVSASQSFALKSGEKLKVQLPELGRNATATATIDIVAPVFDAKSGTVKVACILNNSQGKIRSGMRCLLELPTDNSSVAATAGPGRQTTRNRRP